MPTVLVPTDNTSNMPGFTRGYAARGWEVIVGAQNFFNKAHRADMVHFQWPEEFSGWTPPTPKIMDRIGDALEWWSRRCPNVVSVHNLLPHGFEDDPAFKQLYGLFYDRCGVIQHFSQSSKELVLRAFPSASLQQNIVTNYFNYDRLLPAKLDRDACRGALGFGPDDFVVLVFGMLRFWREVDLVRRAYAGAKVPGKRLLMAGRYNERTSPMVRRFRRARFKLWTNSVSVVVPNGYIEDEDVHRYLEACDVILIPRFTDLNSGLLGLGVTFGRTMVVPSFGAYAEYLEGTGNLFYDPGDAASMARAIERAAVADREVISRQNRAIGDRWTWERIAASAIQAAGMKSERAPAV